MIKEIVLVCNPARLIDGISSIIFANKELVINRIDYPYDIISIENRNITKFNICFSASYVHKKKIYHIHSISREEFHFSVDDTIDNRNRIKEIKKKIYRIKLSLYNKVTL